MQDVKLKPLSTSEIINEVAELTKQNKKIVKQIIEEYEQTILVDLLNKQEAKVGILGKIKIKVRQTRVGVNPTTGEKVIIPGKAVPKFMFSKAVKEVVDEKFSTLLDINYNPNTINSNVIEKEVIEDESIQERRESHTAVPQDPFSRLIG